MADKMKDGKTAKSILVVEDNALVLEHVSTVVKSLGYEVVEATDGPSALAKIDDGTPIDLLFTDMVMPGGISGRDLADQALEKRPELKVLFTTGFSAEGFVPGGSFHPETNLLRKPYKKIHLEEKLRAVLNGD